LQGVLENLLGRTRMLTRRSAIGCTLFLALAVLALIPAAAFAVRIQQTAQTRESCTDPKVVQPFRDYGDSRNYILAPGGAFERLDTDISPSGSLTDLVDLSSLGWTTRGGVIGPGNEPFFLNRRTDNHSFRLPEGTFGTSPAMCVDLNYPIFRLVARPSGILRTSDAMLRVKVIYPNVDDPRFKTVDTLRGGQGRYTDLGWHISPDLDMLPHRGGRAPGKRLVAMRFVALQGSWRIDDIFVDPRKLR
jgi:hypothetical protein